MHLCHLLIRKTKTNVNITALASFLGSCGMHCEVTTFLRGASKSKLYTEDGCCVSGKGAQEAAAAAARHCPAPLLLLAGCMQKCCTCPAGSCLHADCKAAAFRVMQKFSIQAHASPHCIQAVSITTLAKPEKPHIRGTHTGLHSLPERKNQALSTYLAAGSLSIFK